MALTQGEPLDTKDLQASYGLCRRLHREHGTTYYRATSLLPRAKRPAVHALYGFCRYADEIVDAIDGSSLCDRTLALDDLEQRLMIDLARGWSAHPVLAAVVDTATRYRLDPRCFERFMTSMRMDLTVSSYPTFDELLRYMDGSAAVIGEMVLPVLEPTSPLAFEPARALGDAFQLTNFWRDVGEDLDRGRVYLPQDDIDRFGARSALENRVVTDEWRALLRFEIGRTREIYVAARAGLDLLPPSSRRCVATAFVLYQEILDRIEANDFEVFHVRARVPAWRKVAVAAGFAGRRPTDSNRPTHSQG